VFGFLENRKFYLKTVLEVKRVSFFSTTFVRNMFLFSEYLTNYA
jgi:hypothetical protein